MSNIELVTLAQSPALVVQARCSSLAIGRIMPHAYKTIYGYLQSQGVACGVDNMPYCVYRQIDWDHLNSKGIVAQFQMMFLLKWELEIGVPVPEGTAPGPDMQAGVFPAGRFLRALHKGAYHKTGHTYRVLCEYAKGQGHVLKDFSIERYLNDPKQVKACELMTELLVPVQ